MFNFCVFVFISYAVCAAVKMIDSADRSQKRAERKGKRCFPNK
ncbi:MAG: hypothetical protein ACI4IS_03590 [Acutalibacteraceae bacterium]